MRELTGVVTWSWWITLMFAGAIIGASTANYQRKAVWPPSDAGYLQQVDRLSKELKEMTVARDVEYWSHQCDRQTRAELARCGCTCVEAK